VQERGFWLDGIEGVEDRGQLLVVNFDEPYGLFRYVLIHGCDRSDLLPHKAYPILCHHRHILKGRTDQTR